MGKAKTMLSQILKKSSLSPGGGGSGWGGRRGRGERLRTIGGASFLFFVLLFSALAPVVAAGKDWKGVDEAVVEKVAAEHGRHAGKPLIDPGDGDILLFAFLMAGGGAGFAAGYYWRALTEKHRGDAKEAGKP